VGAPGGDWARKVVEGVLFWEILNKKVGKGWKRLKRLKRLKRFKRLEKVGKGWKRLEKVEKGCGALG
jgi:hypothetical protein